MAFDWTQLPLANTPWRIQVVADILPILIRRAKEGRPIFYGELAEQLEREFGHEPKARKTVYGPAVGAVGLAIEQLGLLPEWRGERIPPINTIVVSKSTGYPSTGADEIAHYFFEDNGAGMAADRKAYLDAAMNAVYHFDKWDQIAAALGVARLQPASGELEADKGDVLPLPKVQAGGAPESAEHQALKRWVREHLEELADFGTFEPGRNEAVLSSGDRLDVLFENGKQRLAVEVKTSKCSEDELMRGVYQCVKYRAILRAEQLAIRQVPNGEAVLVCPRAPKKATMALIKRLNVNFHRVPVDAEK
ncbi:MULTISPECIES: hypothetical protein [Xanthomonas]|uniref:hypothetical protein n=1 Tax=Xanthomonas TaxID=338 RepID=UPI0023797204|nr:hypothetical protein [Xanthomonas campestris]WDL17324.1 hypothetical protein JH285_19135 [Xanthomonas campestris pv. campestris]WDL21406.1 hypothetical protein JH268_19125 [Xanthomonas campestris pv. campestris]WDL26512.1 hypothetical protein JH276_02650 [Xanthomonas campestris pv. campestris]WDL29580.1 hypothetical protein JH297_19170 [Xanthomonas campestris pv. campestris]WDL34694.1 hypothetical protein JH255_02665 [Xanthomonas campestris pv. campestris]